MSTKLPRHPIGTRIIFRSKSEEKPTPRPGEVVRYGNTLMRGTVPHEIKLDGMTTSFTAGYDELTPENGS